MRLVALPLWTFKTKKWWPWARKAENLQVTGIKQKDQGSLVTPSWGKSLHQDKNSFWWERVVTVGINISGNSRMSSDNNFLGKISSLFEVPACLYSRQLAFWLVSCLSAPVCASLLKHPVLLQSLSAPGYRSESKWCGGSISIWACAMVIVTWWLSGIISKTLLLPFPCFSVPRSLLELPSPQTLCAHLLWLSKIENLCSCQKDKLKQSLLWLRNRVP